MFLFDFFLVFAMIAENLLGFIAYLMGTGGGFNFSWLAVRCAETLVSENSSKLSMVTVNIHT